MRANLATAESSFYSFLPLQEAGVGLSVGETSTSHSHVFQQPQVLHLVAAALVLKEQRGFDVVGLDAADVVGLLQRGIEVLTAAVAGKLWAVTPRYSSPCWPASLPARSWSF